ncbi:hypothetical protein [Flavobacterium sp. LAR06]
MAAKAQLKNKKREARPKKHIINGVNFASLSTYAFDFFNWL